MFSDSKGGAEARAQFEAAIDGYQELRSGALPKTTIKMGAASFLDTMARETVTGMKNLVIGQLGTRLYKNLFHWFMSAAGDTALASSDEGGDDLRDAIRNVVWESLNVL